MGSCLENSIVRLKKPSSPSRTPVLPDASKRVPSPHDVRPRYVEAATPSSASLSTMLITPAMASEPYWDAAPSRSTSIRLIDCTGMARRSVPVVPNPSDAITLGNAAEWRRLPLTRTSTWSGFMPRSVAT